jgi:NitT/TauT family transport system permease protein
VTRHALAAFFLPLIGFACFVAAWYAIILSRIVDPVLLPRPDTIAKTISSGLSQGTLGKDLWITTQRMAFAIVLAMLIGVPTGLVLGISERLYRSVEFIIDFLRSTPASAVFPLFLVIFGVDDRTKIYIGMFGATLAIIFNTAYGVMNARKTRLSAAKLMGAPPIHMLLVVFLESMPQTFIGLRTGISISLVSVIVAEMFLGSNDGIGHRVFEAQQIFDMPVMYAAIVCAGILGYGLNVILRVSERRFVHWSGK